MAKDSKSKAIKKETREPYFGLPHGEKDTPQLRKRFKNYVKKNEHTFGHADKLNKHKLLRDNQFYEFNKKDYD